MSHGFRKILFLITLLLWSQPYCLADEVPQEDVPEDVAEFIKERFSCDHFRGEPRNFDEWVIKSGGEEAERRQQERADFLEKMTKETCSGIDTKLLGLKEKYSNDPEILTRLDRYSLLVVEDAYIQLHLANHFPNAEQIEQELIKLGIWEHSIELVETSITRGNTPELLLGKNLDSDAIKWIVKTVLKHCTCDPRIAVIGSSASRTVYIGEAQPWKKRYLAKAEINHLLSADFSEDDYKEFGKDLHWGE